MKFKKFFEDKFLFEDEIEKYKILNEYRCLSSEIGESDGYGNESQYEPGHGFEYGSGDGSGDGCGNARIDGDGFGDSDVLLYSKECGYISCIVLDEGTYGFGELDIKI